jgi:hypothetical protein
MPRARDAKRKRKIPPPGERCISTTKKKTRCKRKKAKGSDYCTLCDPSRRREIESKGGLKGAEAKRERKAEIDRAVEALPLLQPVQQARFLNYLIEQELACKNNRPNKSKNTVRWSLVNTWLAQLRAVTADVKVGRIVRHTRKIVMQRQTVDGRPAPEPRPPPPPRKK